MQTSCARYLAGLDEHERRRHVDDAVAAGNRLVVAAGLVQARLQRRLLLQHRMTLVQGSPAGIAALRLSVAASDCKSPR